MLHKNFNTKIFIAVFALTAVFCVANFVYAGNPTTPISPGDNVLDPGSPSTTWGGCGPSDSNCYVTTPWTNSGSDIYFTGGNVGIGDTTPAALFTVGNGDLFKINSSGIITSAAGITSSGTITFSGLGGGGTQCLQVSNTGVLSASGAGCGVASGGANASLDNLASVAINTDLLPGVNDGAALGSGAKSFSDLFLASGGVINFNNGNITLTHSAGVLTLAGGDLKVTSAANASTSVLTTDATQTVTNKNFNSGTNTFPTLNQNTTGSAAKWTTARLLAGNSVDGSGDVAFANKFIVQGTTDSGLSGAQFLGALGTGILKNTTTTGVLSIAVAGDFPTLNQNTTGSAATLTTPRAIYGNNFDGSAALTQVIASTYGGTGNGFTKFSGPASTEKTFTLPNANATILTDNAAVTVAQGGTNCTAASITCFNNITGFSAGTTGTTSTNLVFSTSPTLVTPNLGTPTAVVLTNATGTATGLTAGAANNLSGGAGGQIIYQSASGTTSFLANGSAGQILTSNGGTSAPSWGNAGAGNVDTVSVVTANGFAGSSSGGVNPALTLSTTVTGLLKGNGTAISAATSGTDYSAGTSALATGILKSTTSTGVLSIAVAGDFPTLNQNTTGSAATLTTARNIYGNSFNGSADLTQVIASTYGGTGNGFTKFSGPASSEKTFTLPNADATILTDNAAVTVAQGGTNCTSASLTCFNNITGLSAGGTTGNASSNLVFSGSPTLVTPVLGAATYTTLSGGDITDSSLTATHIVFAGTAGILSHDTGFTFTSATDQLLLGENGQSGSLKIYSEDGSTDHSTIFQPGTQTQNITYTLPVDDGTANQFLQSDGSGVLSWATAVASVSGTTNRITSTGGTTPVIDISASYVGQSSITTLGTITTGVWNGTTIAVANGGTGTSNGSITGTTALTFAAGGTAQNINLIPTTSGAVVVSSSTANTDTIKLLPQTSGTGATFNGIITTADLTGSDKTYTFPNSSITVNAAADISGTTLASNVVSSSLTSVGTLTSLNLSGAITGATDLTTSGTNTLSGLAGGGIQCLQISNTGVISGTGTACGVGGSGANPALSNLSSVAINTDLVLGVSDSGALGSASKMWSDLFLASGAVINFNNGDVTLTHSSGLLTLAGDLKVTSAGNVSTSVVTTDATQTLSNKDLTSGTNTFPTLNQNTTGSAATLTTARNIYGNSFNGSADLNQIIASTYGGTGNGFTKFSGPASSEKTFTLPNANAVILTDNALVTVAQGGTGTSNGSITGTTALTFAAGGTAQNINLIPTTSGAVVVSSSTANTDTIKLLPQTSGTGATFNGIITTADLTGSDKTYTFPNSSITVNAAADISGTTLASNVVSSSLTSVGTLTSGATGSGFTVALGASTVTGILGSANGGTGNGFTKFSGPASSEKTFALPNANATILTDNALVTVAQGGTGTSNGSITGTGALTFAAGGSAQNINLIPTTSGAVVVSSSTANTDTIKLLPQTSGTVATFNAIITTADITGSDKTYTFPNSSITVNAAADISGTTLAANVVSSSLTSVGTIASGTWNGTQIGVAYGGTNCTSASLTCFNNITGYSAGGATGNTSSNLVFSNSPTLVTPVLGAATYTTLSGGNITDSGLTNTRVTFAGASGILSDDAGFTFTAASDQLLLGENGQSGSLKIYSEDGATDHSTIFQPGTQTQNITYTLPVDDGTSNQFLQSDGSGVLSWATAVTSVSGTTNRITSSGGATPTIDISASYVGQSSITTLGTITTGVWNGTAIAVANGGTACTSASITCFNNITGLSAAGTTGTTSTNLVFSTSPTLVTPNIGAATATTINGNTFTTGTYTLTGASGKTLTFNNSLTFAGTDGTTLTFPSASDTVAGLGTTQTFTKQNTFSEALTVASGTNATLDDVNIAAATTTVTGSTNITTAKGFNKVSIYKPTYTDSSSVTVSNGATLYIEDAPAASGSLTLSNGYALWVDNGNARFDGHLVVEGVTSTGATGTGKFVFDASPTFTGTVTIPTPFTLGATSVTSTGTQLNYLNAATGTTGTTSSNLVFSNSPTLVTPVLGAATYTTLSGGNITDSGLTNTRVTFAGASGILSDDAGFTFTAASDQLLLGENGQSGSLKIYSEDGATDHSTIFQPGTQTQNITYTLPVDDGNANQVLTTDGSGVLSWTTSTSGITVGTTTVSSGTSTRILYDNAGVVGEYTISGSGTVVAMTNSPTFTTPSLGAATGTSLNLTYAGTTATTTSSGLSLAANSLTSGTGIYAESSTLTSGKLADLQVSGTAAANNQTALNILTTGANGTSSISTYGAKISNTHTGTSAVDYAGYFTATAGGTTSTAVGLYTTATGGTTANIGLNVDAGQTLLGGTTLSTGTLAKLNIVSSMASSGSTTAIAGIHGEYTINPSSGGTQVGNRFVMNNAPTSTANTSVNEIIRTIDNTSLANTVRGIEIVSNAGSNTAGVNTGIRSTGATFGGQFITPATAGGVSLPAAIYAESTGTTQGDVARLYTGTMTSATAILDIYHDTSTFTGAGILLDMAHSTGTFSGNFIDAQNASVTKFKVTSAGNIYTAGNIGINTTTPGALFAIEDGTSSDEFRLGDQSGGNYYKIGRNTGTGTLDFTGTQSGFVGYLFNNTDNNFNVYNSAGTSRINVSTGTSAAIAGITLTNNSRAYTWYLDNRGSNEAPNDRFGIFNNAGTEVFTAITNGNIGIGTNGPDRKLDVLDASNPQLRLTYTDGSVYTDLQTNSSGNLYINPSGGNVGVGESAPGRKFTVAGDTSQTLKAGYSSTDSILLSQLEGGSYYGNVGVTENQFDVRQRSVNWIGRGTSISTNGLAMSSNGKIQARTSTSGNIYTSTDYGQNWTSRDSSRSWTAVAMSADGKIQTATVSTGNIYTSTDYGVTWTARDSSRAWTAVDMSADGKIQTATVSSGNIYTSTDYGVTWTSRDSSRAWTGVAVSSDGKIQAATTNTGNIYTSTDYGITWTSRDSSRAWTAIAMSADGKIQTATVSSGNIYTSTDYGVTWTARDSSRAWTAVAMSADGSMQLAVLSSSAYVYYSSDYGVTWAATATNNALATANWKAAAMSSDGKVQLISEGGGSGVYTSYAESYTLSNFSVGTSSAPSGTELDAPNITIGNNSNYGGTLNLKNKSSTDGYIWQDNAGNVRISSTTPWSGGSDTSGTVIGTQTSTRETKQDIQDYTDYNTALNMITAAPLHTFRYKKDVTGYGDTSPLAKTRIGYIADEVPDQFMWGNAIDQVSVNGLLIASVKELNLHLDGIAGINIPNDGTPEAQFVTAFFNNVFSKVKTMLADATNGITDMFAGTFHANDKLCIKETCVTETELKTLIQNSGAANAGSSSTPDNPPADQPPADQPPTDQTPPADNPPADNSGGAAHNTGSTPPGDSSTPPADTSVSAPADTPPATPNP